MLFFAALILSKKSVRWLFLEKGENHFRLVRLRFCCLRIPPLVKSDHVSYIPLNIHLFSLLPSPPALTQKELSARKKFPGRMKENDIAINTWRIVSIVVSTLEAKNYSDF